MARVRRTIQQELPQLSVYLQSGGMVDAVLNQGLPDLPKRSTLKMDGAQALY